MNKLAVVESAFTAVFTLQMENAKIQTAKTPSLIFTVLIPQRFLPPSYHLYPEALFVSDFNVTQLTHVAC